MAERYLKKCLTFLAIREIQIRITLRFHLKPVKMAKINKTTHESSCWHECEVKETLIHG